MGAVMCISSIISNGDSESVHSLTTVTTAGFVYLLCYGEKRNRGKDMGKLKTVELHSARLASDAG